MDRTSYIALLRADADRLFDAVAPALDRPVPTCPGWTCARLAGHVGRVHRWTAGWVRSGEGVEVERAPEGPDVVAWARAGTNLLVEALESASSDGPVDTWAGRQPVSFWPRRMAIELAVHRCDAEGAIGEMTAVDTALALDGIDELFTVVLPWRGTGELRGDGETIHLHATDPDAGELGGGEWLVTLSERGFEVEHAHAKGNVAVRATASDLLLLLYNRVGADRCEVFGDAGLLDRWRENVKI
jgi:uncharacterized protein (TIGR03083 family)